MSIKNFKKLRKKRRNMEIYLSSLLDTIYTKVLNPLYYLFLDDSE